MGLEKVLNVVSTTQVSEDGRSVRGFDITFSTEATSGRHTVFVSEDEFTPDLARRRAEDQAAAIDAVVTPDAETTDG